MKIATARRAEAEAAKAAVRKWLRKSTNGKKKGKRGEQEFADFLKERGYEARRGQQYAGGGDSPDVVGGPDRLHPEVKRVESGNPYNWLAQAKRDAAPGKMPVVFHRRNREGWIAILDADALLALVRELDLFYGVA